MDKLGDYKLSKEEIVQSSYNAYLRNGNKNKRAEAPHPSKLKDYQGGVADTGIARIPICDMKPAVSKMIKQFGPKEALCDYGF